MLIGAERVRATPPLMAADDIAYFARRSRHCSLWIGITPPDQDIARAAPNHSPLWKVDRRECCLGCGACRIWSLTTLVAGEGGQILSECLGAIEVEAREPDRGSPQGYYGRIGTPDIRQQFLTALNLLLSGGVRMRPQMTPLPLRPKS